MKRIYVLKQHEQSLPGEQAFVTNSYHATLASALFGIPEDEKTEAKKRKVNERRKQVASFENYSVEYHTLHSNTAQNSR